MLGRPFRDPPFVHSSSVAATALKYVVAAGEGESPTDDWKPEIYGCGTVRLKYSHYPHIF